MATTFVLENMDAHFKHSTGRKIILNDIRLFSSESEIVNRSIYTTYDTEVLSTVPQCDCGHTKGTLRLGDICRQCDTPVSDPMEVKDPLLWLQAIDNVKLINPGYWERFRLLLSNKDIDWLRWICDSRYNPAGTPPPHVQGIANIIGQRRLSNFIKFFPNIIAYLKEQPKYKKDIEKQYNLDRLLSLFLNNPEVVFCDHLPIVNKRLFVMESTQKGRYINLSVSDVIEVVVNWIKVNNDLKEDMLTPENRQRKVESATVAAISRLANQYYNYFNKYLVFKQGTFRKHVYGARSHFTFRTVIVNIKGKHRYNQCEVPWAVGVTAFRPHLINKLVLKHGYTCEEASTLLFDVSKRYHPLIDKLLQELIAESPYELGIPVLAQRNPSLLQGSAQRIFICKFKTDPQDKSTGFSCKIVTAPNADYDGDELNFTILLDIHIAELARTFDPHWTVPGVHAPYEISGNLSLLKPSTAILNSCLRDSSEDPENDTIYDSLTKLLVEVDLDLTKGIT